MARTAGGAQLVTRIGVTFTPMCFNAKFPMEAVLRSERVESAKSQEI